jgi:hypothetical protein
VAIRTAVQIFIPMTVPGAAMQFRVTWEIDIDAEGPKEAAQQARAIQLKPAVSTTVAGVFDKENVLPALGANVGSGTDFMAMN